MLSADKQMGQVGMQDTCNLGRGSNPWGSPLRSAALGGRDRPRAGSRQRGFVGETELGRAHSDAETRRGAQGGICLPQRPHSPARLELDQYHRRV